MTTTTFRWAAFTIAILCTAAAPVGADDTARKLKVDRVTAASCETDGGAVACSEGVRYLGGLLRSYFNAQLDQGGPIACGTARPGRYTFRMGYEYNGGTMYFPDRDAVVAKWPSCVGQFRDKAGQKWLEWYHVLLPLDQSIDVRSEYTVTVTIK
jgi:hypothetical protein